MSNDDDALAEYDLSAWDAPPPPEGLADAVIDRMGGTDVGIAVPLDEEHQPSPKRAWIIAGAAVAALLLALGVWSLIRSTHKAAPSSGGVLADKARTLDLDSVHADLDPGADVRWRRDGGVWLVEQRAGRAAWRVDGDEKLVVVAGAGLASVEATDANLRVEVQMNAMDARVIGASALTAAAVAMVTVVVYEGHVKVGRGVGQQTVVVAPGTTYTVKNEDEGNLVGATPVAPVASGKKIAVLGLQLDGKYGADAPVVTQVMAATLRAAAQDDGRFQLALNADKELVDEKLLMNCGNEAVACMSAIGGDLGVDLLVFGHIEQLSTGYRITAKLLDVGKQQIASSGQWALGITEAQGKGLDTWANTIYADLLGGKQTVCDADALKERGMQHINMGQHDAALTDLEASLACKADSYVVQLAFMESCSSGNEAKAKLYYKQLTPTQQQKLAMICVRQHVAYSDDVDDTVPDGLDRLAIEHGMAQIKDRVFACGKPENAGAKVKMRVTVNPSGSVTNILIEDETTPGGVTKPSPEVTQCMASAINDATFIPTKNGGTFSYPFLFAAPRPPPPANCDADALKEQGMENINMGQHAAALQKLETSLKCKNDPYVVQLAFMESCSSGNSVKAKSYYKQMTRAQQEKFAQICIRQKVPFLDGDPGFLHVQSTPKAKVLVDGADTGLTTPIMGVSLPLTPGKHKITFVIGGDRFTYSVVIKAGELETITKDLR